MKNEDNQTRFNKLKKKTSSSLSTYVKYSSLSAQMILIVLAGCYGGILIDKWIDWNFPAFTLFLSIAGVALAMYIAIKDFLKKK
jgi:F0F1-type ATP synthase assembly protein I